MSVNTWSAIGARLATAQPVDLDDLVFGTADRGPGGGWMTRDVHAPAPAKTLWHLKNSRAAHIAVRVDAPLDNIVQVAASLVAMAAERAVIPVIFSQIAHSGFERFGFRVERLAGADDAALAACEADLKRFWDVAVVIDARDIARLG